jgi:hypothetical protein
LFEFNIQLVPCHRGNQFWPRPPPRTFVTLVICFIYKIIALYSNVISYNFISGAALALYCTLHYEKPLAACIALSTFFPETRLPDPSLLHNKGLGAPHTVIEFNMSAPWGFYVVSVFSANFCEVLIFCYIGIAVSLPWS